MGAQTIGASLLNGFAGTYAQQPDMIIDTHPIKSTSAEVFFGQAVIDGADGTVTKASAAATAANFVGFAAREVKTVYSYTDPNVGGSYLAGEAAAIFKRGVISAICPVGSPAKNGKVYLRIAANSSIPTGIVGDITANADGGNTVELTMCRFTGTKDTNNVVGVRILSLNAA
jgi:hypothetical protein